MQQQATNSGAIGLLNNGIYANYNQSSSLNYPSPWLSLEKHLIPSSFKKAAELICHAFLNNGTINSVIESNAGYPLTKFTFLDNPSEELKESWNNIFTKLKFKSHNYKVGIDYFLFGNGASSVYEPFERYMTCFKCNTVYNTSSKNLAQKWKWVNNKFKIHCNKCKKFEDVSHVTDKPIQNPKKALEKLALIRWNIFTLEVDEHPYSGEQTWVHVVPQRHLSKFVGKGDLKFIEKTPIKIIEAIQAKLQGKSDKAQIEIDQNSISTIQRPMPSMPKGELSGWGLPLAISALRDFSFLTITTRAQTVILHENIVPFRIISPGGIAGAEPHLIDNEKFKKEFEENFQLWRSNPQHAMISSIPAQIQQMGGDSKALNMFAEKQIINQDIIRALNTSKSLMDGDMTFSGGSVALRMFENSLTTYIQGTEELNQKNIHKIAEILRIKPVKVAYLPFKMGEDPQTKQMLMNLNASSKLSDDSLLTVFGYSAKEEAVKIKEEQIKFFANQQIAQAQAQMKAQKVMEYMQTNEPNSLAIGSMPIDPNQISSMMQQMSAMPPDQQAMINQQVQQQNPYLAKTMQNRNELSPQAGIDFLMDLQQTPPDMQGARVDDLETSDPLRKKILDIMSESLGIQLPTNKQSPNPQPVQQNKSNFRPIPSINIGPLPLQRVPRGVGRF